MYNYTTIHKPPPISGTSSMRCKTILFSKASRPALAHTQPIIQCVSREFSPVVKWLQYEAENLHQSSAKFKNGWSYISTPQYAFYSMYRHNFTLFLKKPFVQSFSFGDQCNILYFHRKICVLNTLGEICNQRLFIMTGAVLILLTVLTWWLSPQ